MPDLVKKDSLSGMSLALRRCPGEAEGVTGSVRRGEGVLCLNGRACLDVALKKELESCG